jgi:LysR family transcriptional regulator, nod-box dependent transcriptional activator
MNLENVNLNLLVPLDVLLRTRNVTRAGQELHLSQSATSDVLARLRKTFRDPLLVRQGRELVLTPYAEAVQEQLHDALRLIDQLITQRPDFDPAVDERRFTIVASDYVATVVLGRLLADLATLAPAVTVDLDPLREGFEQRIRRDEVDVLLVSEGVHQGRLDEMPQECLFEDRFMLCAWRDNMAVRPNMAISEFETLPYVQYGMGREAGLADRSLEWLNIRRKIELRTESQLLVPFLLTKTTLVAFVPNRLAQMMQVPAELKVIEPPFDLPPIRQSAIWHPRRSLDPAHSWLRDRLRLAVAPG